MSGFNTPKSSPNGAVKTPNTEIMTNTEIMKTPDSFSGSQALETENEQLRRDNIRLKRELQDCLPKHGETPSTVLAIRHNNNHNEYQAYTWELVPYTTEHRAKQLPVFDAEGNQIGDSVNKSNQLINEFNAAANQDNNNKKRKIGGKQCTTRRKHGGNKKSCKRTKKR